MAGGPGDRWLGHREMAEREESPDTVLRHADHFAGVFNGEREVVGGTLDRATRLVTPGGDVEDGGVNPPLRRRHGKCHRE
jgi:hypothetical protein